MAPRYIDPDALQAREDEILDRALELISVHGIVALTMDKLVAQVSYSKGTVYNHFCSKEDVFAALCNREIRSISRLFVRAASVECSARKRMIAIGYSYMVSVLLSPQNFTLVMHAKTEMFDKASSARRDEHAELDQRLFGIICNIIDDAVVNGELVLKEGADSQQISFALWSMCFGTIGLLLDGEKFCSTTSGMMLEDRVVAHERLVMDGLGWKCEDDEERFIEYLKSSVFSDEIKLLAQQGVFL